MRGSTIWLFTLLAVPALWLSPCPPAAAASHDLTADWSDASNPNGAWSYRSGSTVLAAVADWTLLTEPTVQPAWAPGQSIPAWLKSVADSPKGMDFLSGDVVVHSAGVGDLAANVLWTSPVDSVIALRGAAWMVRDIDRSNNWLLLRDGVVLTSGSVFSGDAYSRASPFDFADGSAGASALQLVPVLVGTTIELRVERTSGNGDFVGLRLEIIDDSLFGDGFE